MTSDPSLEPTRDGRRCPAPRAVRLVRFAFFKQLVLMTTSPTTNCPIAMFKIQSGVI